MRVTGANRILVPTSSFDELLGFFREVMAMPVGEAGVPVTDTQFRRYAVIELGNDVVLEVVEPQESVAHRYHSPIMALTVEDVAQARQELQDHRIEFVTPIFDTGDGWGWFYFQAPDGNLYQLQGPCQEPHGRPSVPDPAADEPAAPSGDCET